jgi:hypothetical protein
MPMVSRMEKLRAELTSGRSNETERSKPNTRPTGSGDTPREVVIERLNDRERLARMAERGEIKLGSGKVPDDFWMKPRPADPKGEVLSALLDQRESGS